MDCAGFRLPQEQQSDGQCKITRMLIIRQMILGPYAIICTSRQPGSIAFNRSVTLPAESCILRSSGTKSRGPPKKAKVKEICEPRTRCENSPTGIPSVVHTLPKHLATVECFCRGLHAMDPIMFRYLVESTI